MRNDDEAGVRVLPLRSMFEYRPVEYVIHRKEVEAANIPGCAEFFPSSTLACPGKTLLRTPQTNMQAFQFNHIGTGP